MVFSNKQNKLCHFLINLDNNGYGEQDADAEQDSEKKCEKNCWHSGSNLSFYVIFMVFCNNFVIS